MIHIIAGEKGKGKTKAMKDKDNNEVKIDSSTVVFLDNNNKHLYELSNRVKMINCTSYGISKLESFTGFVRGIISQNSDIEKIYIDNFKTVAYVGESHIVEALDEIKNISDMFNVDIVICLATDVNDVPEDFKDCVIAAL